MKHASPRFLDEFVGEFKTAAIRGLHLYWEPLAWVYRAVRVTGRALTGDRYESLSEKLDPTPRRAIAVFVLGLCSAVPIGAIFNPTAGTLLFVALTAAPVAALAYGFLGLCRSSDRLVNRWYQAHPGDRYWRGPNAAKE